MRRLQYSESVDYLVRFRDLFRTVTIVECLDKSPPVYLQRPGISKIAVSRNSVACTNKGIQEFVNIAKYLESSGVNHEELIMKLTGRYLLLSDQFPVLCSSSGADVIAKRDDDLWSDRGKGVHTFLFGARVKVFINFKNWLLYEGGVAQVGQSPIEWAFKSFGQQRGLRIAFVERPLGVRVRYADDNPDCHVDV